MAEREPELSEEQAAGRIFINGHPEQRYWSEIAAGERSGEWTSFGAGPPVSVVVTPKGLELYGRGLRLVAPLRPGQARWLAVRILEGLGIYEATFAGDGTAPVGATKRPDQDGLDLPSRDVLTCEGCGRTASTPESLEMHQNECDQIRSRGRR